MPARRPTSPPEALRDRRRGEIVAAARRIVAEEGLEGLTIARLEARLAFTRGVITYHFRDKDDIVMAVLASALEEIDAATKAEVEASQTLSAKVRAVLHSKVSGFLDRAEASRILLSYWGRIGSTPAIRAANARLYAGYREQARRLLERAPDAPAGLDADGLAALLVGIVLGVVAQASFDPGAIDPLAAVEEAARALEARLAPAAPRPRRARVPALSARPRRGSAR